MDNKQIKNNLRQFLMKKHSADKKKELQIRKKVKKFIEKHNPMIIGAYWPIRNEFNILPVIEEWLQEHPDRIACLPVIIKNNLCLKFSPWHPGMQMEQGPFGIPIPYKHQNTITQVPNLLLIPCLGFDSDGFRLGYGGGYYDCTITELRKNKKNKFLTVGIASERSKLDQLPREAHDQVLDHIITDL